MSEEQCKPTVVETRGSLCSRLLPKRLSRAAVWTFLSRAPNSFKPSSRLISGALHLHTSARQKGRPAAVHAELALLLKQGCALLRGAHLPQVERATR